jgi:nitroreductase
MSHSTLSPQDLLATLRWRYATKQFDAKRKIPDEVWDVLEEALVLAPSSFGLQLWRFYVVKNPELRAKLKEASWDQTQTTDASHFVVFAAKTSVGEAEIDAYIQDASKTQGVPLEKLEGLQGMISGFVSQMHQKGKAEAWMAHQVYIALGQLMTSAAALGLDTCPMEGIDPLQYDEILGLPDEGYRTLVACAFGYRSPDDKYASLPKVRYPRDQIVKEL